MGQVQNTCVTKCPCQSEGQAEKIYVQFDDENDSVQQTSRPHGRDHRDDRTAVAAKEQPQPHKPATAAAVQSPWTPLRPNRWCWMVLGFETVKGDCMYIAFTHRPLGITFDTRAPDVVDAIKAGSFAEQRGVQPRWRVFSVNGQFLIGRDAQFKHQLLTTASLELPEVKDVVAFWREETVDSWNLDVM
eukprot:gnl/TRDRNA2_/TRDRNA2_143827_c0_seq3.p1 gnl/TRDRNA2_/TRDRNA2_143827_c0~~gnl/TRDRNA2_/TRDRNA2_143827_c0_seq3.p1  ORF type:complete len:188 (+),score=23.27 gnl/TRDRNA2_/TRDRNA2_143827_c0_seq3:26-589(+)